jgi:3',5'-cyclic AMP phosphodiesterase CpdA
MTHEHDTTMKFAILLLLAIQAEAGKVWHFTDVHLDPIYVVNSTWSTSSATNQYCNGNVTSNVSEQAKIFGESGGDCATPRSLYQSAAKFLGQEPESDIVLFTGDFTQASFV